jgi:hypothetical protein
MKQASKCRTVVILRIIHPAVVIRTQHFGCYVVSAFRRGLRNSAQSTEPLLYSGISAVVTGVELAFDGQSASLS